MIARKHRFHGYGSLRYTYQNGTIIRGQYGILRYTRNGRRKSYRVAVVVSKKVSKSAVVRNRIRRRIYEIVRENIVPDQPYDLIITVFSEHVAVMPVGELSTVLLSKLRGIRIVTRELNHTNQHDIVKDKKEIM